MKHWLLLLFLPALGAHDIPRDITVRAFVRPQGATLQVLVRLPLAALRDVVYPELPGGYLDIERLAPVLREAVGVWLVNDLAIYEDAGPLAKPRIVATQISLPSDRSFASLDAALAHVRGAMPTNAERLVWDQVLLDVLLEYPIRAETSRFSVRPGFERLAARALTVLRFLPPGGSERVYEFVGDPGVVPLDPSWPQAAWRFVRMGFWHILSGPDHLLFLLCLVLPFRQLRPLVWVVTAFTVAHSVTLITAALDLAPDRTWFAPLIEFLIAVSIFWMALANIDSSKPPERRWAWALFFGLIHGFGFSFALRETFQFAGSHLLTSLVSFNLGVELGQLVVLLLLLPALQLLFRFVVAERVGVIIFSALVAHTAWHWMLERWTVLRLF